MSEVIVCPCCNENMKYIPQYEGKVCACPHCNQRIIMTKTGAFAIHEQSRNKCSNGTARENLQEISGKAGFKEPRHTVSRHTRNQTKSIDEKAGFKEPLIATTMHCLAVLSYICIGFSFFPVLLTKGEPEAWIIFITVGIGCIFQALIYQALSEYFSRSLRYQWETSENTKRLVEMLRK